MHMITDGSLHLNKATNAVAEKHELRRVSSTFPTMGPSRLVSFAINAIWMYAVLCSANTSVETDEESVYNTHEDNAYEDLRLSNLTHQLNSLLNGYDKRLRPNFYGPPVKVLLNMHVSSISSISEADMDYTVDFYLRQVWEDPRLQFKGIEDQVTISNEVLDSIWWPDTFFTNAKSSKTHLTTVKNAFIRIGSDGTVLFSMRLTVTAFCYLDLTFFPMDTQCCTLEIESYGYSAKEIIYNWMKQGNDTIVKISDQVQLSQYRIVAIREVEKIIELSTGNYSRLSCEFYFARSLGWYVVQIYLPTNLIVLVSWVSFWLSREAVPARVALGITAILTITTLISNTNSSLPKISYLKSIDIYLVVCFIMVFASLLEYAAVSYIGKSCFQKKMKNCACQKDVSSMKKNEGPFSKRDMYRGNGFRNDNLKRDHYKRQKLKPVEETHKWLSSNYETTYTMPDSPGAPVIRDAPVITNGMCCGRVQNKNVEDTSCGCFIANPSNIDKYSRWLFPTLYIIFNLCYWSIYLYLARDLGVPKDARRL